MKATKENILTMLELELQYHITEIEEATKFMTEKIQKLESGIVKYPEINSYLHDIESEKEYIKEHKLILQAMGRIKRRIKELD